MLMPDPTGGAADWSFKIGRRGVAVGKDYLLIWIQDPGGQMDSETLIHGQDDWMAEFLEERPGVKRIWGTTWTVQQENKEELIETFIREAGARVVGIKEYHAHSHQHGRHR